MPIIILPWFTRADLRANPERLYVFGDNFARAGYGGQAAECRDEPNAVGIVTKRSPSLAQSAFLDNGDLADWARISRLDFGRVENALTQKKEVALPKKGLGTGRAKLKECAPLIWDALIDRMYSWFEISAAKGARIHSCPDWNGMVIGEDDPEFEACTCFKNTAV